MDERESQWPVELAEHFDTLGHGRRHADIRDVPGCDDRVICLRSEVGSNVQSRGRTIAAALADSSRYAIVSGNIGVLQQIFSE
jgi:hypothetical protein